MIAQEVFECCNCFHIGALNSRGGCERCGSQSVISQELIARTPIPAKYMSPAGVNSACTTATATR